MGGGTGFRVLAGVRAYARLRVYARVRVQVRVRIQAWVKVLVELGFWRGLCDGAGYGLCAG